MTYRNNNNNYIILLILTTILFLVPHFSEPCRTSCGKIPIRYPFGIDDGCGSPYYRRLLVCSGASGSLDLRTPSGRYPVRNIIYGPGDPHLVIADPSMWTCRDGADFRPTAPPFSLDASTRLSLSSQNDYLFFNCSASAVIVETRPMFCERFPEKCDSSCDSSSYLCRHLPECEDLTAAGRVVECCSYYPKATESVRLMLRHCASYTSVYWRNTGATQPYDQVPEYGIRVDFDVPVTTRCLQCQDMNKGGGTCGFDVHTHDFLCLCENGKQNYNNVTTFCNDHTLTQHRRVGVIAGTVSAVSAGGILLGIGIWYLLKLRPKAPVTCGVQSNENRLF